MKRWLGYWLLLGFPAMSRAASPLDHDIKYSFATRDYSIRLSVAFFEPYWGRRLSFFTKSFHNKNGTVRRPCNVVIGAGRPAPPAPRRSRTTGIATAHVAR